MADHRTLHAHCGYIDISEYSIFSHTQYIQKLLQRFRKRHCLGIIPKAYDDRTDRIDLRGTRSIITQIKSICAIIMIIYSYAESINLFFWKTAIIQMAVFMVIFFPCQIVLQNVGIRKMMVIGSGLNAFGAVIKCGGIDPQLFGVTLTAQFIIACSKCFIVTMPTRIANAWFPMREVSLAAG